ncbi:MAG: DUF1501 domain-containing protein [Myxococcota bacterium]
MLTRRTLLQTFAVGGSAFGLSTLWSRPSWAAGDRSFVFCYFRGGWDNLMALDPRDPAVFTADRREETRIELAWDLLPADYGEQILQPAGSNIPLGPVCDALLPHVDRMTVVNGISMDTVAHDVGRRYFITGQKPAGSNAVGSAIPTRIAAQQGDLSAFPNLVVRTETYNSGDPAYASGLSVSSVADLITALTEGPSAPPAVVRGHLDAFRARTTACDPAVKNRRGLLDLLSDSQSKSRELVDGGLSNQFAFTNTQDPEMAAIAQRYGITNLDGVEAQAAMAFQALRLDLAQCVTIELAPSLDTHDATWATAHPPQLSAGFAALGQLLTDLAETADPSRGGQLIDHTTVIAFSEFGRTPLLNARTGRDHSLTGSCLLAGAGVPGNRVVGRSSDIGMAPMAIDPVTGLPDDSGIMLNPSNILASIMASAGLSTTSLRTDGLPCLMA